MPAAPNPINASVLGSGIEVTLPPVRPGGFPLLQAGKSGSRLQSGFASSDVEVRSKSTAIVVFILVSVHEYSRLLILKESLVPVYCLLVQLFLSACPGQTRQAGAQDGGTVFN